jgi:hypothetical protein
MARQQKRSDEMANNLAEVEKTATDLVETGELTPAQMAALAQEDSGLGASDRSEDRIQAFVKVLHQLSPELNAREAAYVKGANAGDIWIAAQNLLIPGQEGFMFQQVGYQYFWVEWPSKTPSAGSFPIDRHKSKPRGQDDGPGTVNLDNGHVAIETRYHIGLVYYKDHPAFPAVISYSSTGAAVSSNWTNRQWVKRNPDGSMAPTYPYLWHMATVERSNEHGRWYLLVPSRGNEITANATQFKTGRDLAKQFAAQEIKVAEQGTAQDEIPF